jgi:hypothetical protein
MSCVVKNGCVREKKGEAEIDMGGKRQRPGNEGMQILGLSWEASDVQMLLLGQASSTYNREENMPCCNRSGTIYAAPPFSFLRTRALRPSPSLPSPSVPIPTLTWEPRCCPGGSLQGLHLDQHRVADQQQQLREHRTICAVQHNHGDRALHAHGGGARVYRDRQFMELETRAVERHHLGIRPREVAIAGLWRTAGLCGLQLEGLQSDIQAHQGFHQRRELYHCLNSCFNLNRDLGLYR